MPRKHLILLKEGINLFENQSFDIRDWIEEYVDEKTAQEIRIQYGGSATAENAPELSNYPDIDGFLVGGASLKPEICEIVKEIAVAKNTFAMGGA